MHFFPLWFRLDFSQIYSLFVSLLKKNCSCIEEGDTFYRALRAHITCKLRSAHSVSVLRQKKLPLPFIGRSHCSVPAAKKIPSQKNCISKSPVEKSSVVPSNVCLGSATNHKLHESFPPLHRLYNSL